MFPSAHSPTASPPPIRPARAAKRAGRAAPAPDRLQGSAPAGSADHVRARAWIDAARECNLVVFPFFGLGGSPVVSTCGEEMSGPRDHSAGQTRFQRRRISKAAEELPPGLLFEVLCVDFGVLPNDPDLCAKVNARLAEEAIARRTRSRHDDGDLIKLCRRARAAIQRDEDLEAAFPMELAPADANGLTRLRRASARAVRKSTDLLVAVSNRAARTSEGLAYKAAVLVARTNCGYSLVDPATAQLAMSIADDAREIGTSEPKTARRLAH